MIAQETLDELWDFADPVGSEQRIRAADTNRFALRADRNELSTQVARALGMQGRHEEALHLLDLIDDGGEPVVLVRILLERGRVLLAAGQAADAMPLFEDAAHLAAESGLDYLAADAMQMAAATDPYAAAEWAETGLAVVDRSSDPLVRRWAPGFHLLLARAMEDQGEDEAAAEQFRLAGESGTAGTAGGGKTAVSRDQAGTATTAEGRNAPDGGRTR
jgi:tetratricopeptide (TPR) repeat protein